jgi:adenosylhomocysteine nucleosidase
MMNRVGIIGAMEEEIVLLKEKIEVQRTDIFANMEFYSGEINNKTVIIVKCGVGKVNAAICTQILIDRFNVNYILNTGVAGAVSEKLDIGDIIISDEVLYHDVDVTALGFDIGVVPWMEQSIFNADKNLINIIKNAYKDTDKISVGRIVSGDQFIQSEEKRKSICEKFNPLCVEMEAAAIAHTCYVNNIPFVVIRSISDKANSSAEINFIEFLRGAAERSANVIEKVMKEN